MNLKTLMTVFALATTGFSGAAFAETETIGFWTFDGSTPIDMTTQDGSPSGNGVPQRTNTWFPNQVPGGKLTMFLQKGTWQGYEIGTTKYIDEVPAGYLFSDTALTNRICGLTKSLRLGAGATGSYCTGWGLTIPNFMDVIGTNESFTVEVLMRVYSQSQDGGTYTQGGGPLIGIGRKAETMSDDQDAAALLKGYSGPNVGIYAYDPNATEQDAYKTFTAKHGWTPDRCSTKNVLAGGVWRTVTLCWNAGTRKLTYRSDYQDAICTADDKVNTLVEFGTNSIFRIGGFWKNRNSFLSYVLGTVDVAAVRVKRGLAAWYEDLTPWYEETPRNLGHWRFDGANGSTADKVMPNAFATNLSFTSCVDRKTSSGDWGPLLTTGSFTNQVWAPYIKTASEETKHLPNTSAFSSYVNGVSATPQLRIQNLPMYLIDDFTLEFVFLTTTENYREDYNQPAIVLMRAPEDTARYFYLSNMQSNWQIGYRGEQENAPTTLFYGNIGLTRLVWQHIAIVRERAAGTIAIYRNGELKGTKTLAADAKVWCGDATSYAYTQLMSNQRNTWESDYKGLVDEIRFTRAVLEPKDFLKGRHSEGSGLTLILR